MPPAIAVEGLNAGYLTDEGYVRVLRDVSLEVPEGAITGIVGESGSGKSTLANIMVGLVSPPLVVESGRVVIEGKYDLLSLSEDELNRLRGKVIAYVPQAAQNSLNPVFKVKRIIADILAAHNIDMESHMDLVLDTLQEVGLARDKQILELYPFQMSGGMKQRLIIAMALMLDPRIVVMDEPTTGLDVVTQHEILKVIKRVQRERNLTMVFISHDIAMLFQVVDYMAVMYAGEVVEYADYKTLLEDPHHPYTYLLLNSIPSIVKRGQKLARLPGEFEGFSNLPPGCALSSRCPFATPECRTTHPPLVAYPRGAYRCLRYPAWRDETGRARLYG